jgi:PAS domain S-box-containing protein
MDEQALLDQRFKRERAARKEAERLLEEKSRELFDLNEELQSSADVVRENETRIRAILENMNDALITHGADRNIVNFSSMAKEYFGYSFADVENTEIDQLIAGDECTPDGLAFLEKWRLGSFEIFASRGVELTMRRKDGSTFPAEVSIGTVGGKNQLYIITLRDISDRKDRQEQQADLERRLRQSQKMESLGTLAGGTAHEFNNMLVPMISLTEMVQEELDKDSDEFMLLGKALEAGDRAKGLVKQILSFSREHEQEYQTISLDQIVNDAIPLLQSVIPSTIEIISDVIERSLPTLGDTTEIHQIVTNLVTNAAYAIDGTGTVSITLTHDTIGTGTDDLTPGEYGKLTVADTGSGMDEATQAKIFDPFFTTKPVGEGTGMGLSVIHAIMTRVEGTIKVRSTPGEGTTFDLFFPICTDTDCSETSEQPALMAATA